MDCPTHQDYTAADGWRTLYTSETTRGVMGARCDTMYRPEAAGVSAAATCAAATSRTSQMMGVPSAALPSISPGPHMQPECHRLCVH